MSNTNDNTKPKSVWAFFGQTASFAGQFASKTMEGSAVAADTTLRGFNVVNKAMAGTADFVEEDLAPLFLNARKSIRDLRLDIEIEQRQYLTEKYSLAEGEDFLKLSDEELIKRRIANQEKEEKATPTSSEEQKK